MTSFNELPDELLVKIFCHLDDYDATKIRLERVSSRFYGCLRESWKQSRRILDFHTFDTIEGVAAFLDRAPETTHLRLTGPEEYDPAQLRQLYQNTHKMHISTLKYQTDEESGQCLMNAQLIIWCVSTSEKYLKSLDFECCNGQRPCGCDIDEDMICCKTLDALLPMLPFCHNLQHVKLAKIHRSNESIFDALAQLTLKSLMLTDVTYFNFDYGGLARLLNHHTSMESVSVVQDQKTDFDEFLDEFSQFVNEDAGLEMRSLKVPVIHWEDMQEILTIQNLLPKLRNLDIKFDWRRDAEDNDGRKLVELIVEFITLGKRKDFEINFDLTVTRERESEYNFGRDFINRLLTLKGARTKRNHNANQWNVAIVDGNVKVCVHTSIDDLYTKQKEAEEQRVKRDLLEWFATSGISPDVLL